MKRKMKKRKAKTTYQWSNQKTKLPKFLPNSPNKKNLQHLPNRKFLTYLIPASISQQDQNSKNHMNLISATLNRNRFQPLKWQKP